jgi:hypothetical protein
MESGGKPHALQNLAEFSGPVLMSGHDGDDAHHYQEKQVKSAIRIIQA